MDKNSSRHFLALTDFSNKWPLLRLFVTSLYQLAYEKFFCYALCEASVPELYIKNGSRGCSQTRVKPLNAVLALQRFLWVASTAIKLDSSS
jgi:hypothetical protein